MVVIEKRFLNGQPVRREEINARPVESEDISRIIEGVRRRIEKR